MLHVLEDSGIAKIFGPGRPEIQGQYRELNKRHHFYLHISIFWLVARIVKCQRLEKFLIRLGDRMN
jgi:hypothetical protein